MSPFDVTEFNHGRISSKGKIDEEYSTALLSKGPNVSTLSRKLLTQVVSFFLIAISVRNLVVEIVSYVSGRLILEKLGCDNKWEIQIFTKGNLI